MRILITGGAGFIGSHLHNALEEAGHFVVSVDNFTHPTKRLVKAVEGDVLNKNLMRMYVQDTDMVFHLAADINVDESIHTPEKVIKNNILGTLNILELCRETSTPLVYASSSEVYGTAQTSPMAEEHPLDAQSPYAASKLAGDRMAKAYMDTYDMQIAILRNFNTFGPYQNDDSYGGVIAKFTKCALAGDPLPIFGDGKQQRDYMYISDAVQAYMRVMGKKGIFNAGTGVCVSVNEIADLIKEITGSKSDIIHTHPRPGEVQKLQADITKISRMGFVPETQFKRDLSVYINWYTKRYE